MAAAHHALDPRASNPYAIFAGRVKEISLRLHEHSDGTSGERRKATFNQCKESGCICGGREEQQRSELLTRELSVHGLGSLGAASDAGEAAGESFTIQLFFSFENFSVEGLPTKKLHLTEMFSFKVSIRQLQIS